MHEKNSISLYPTNSAITRTIFQERKYVLYIKDYEYTII